MNKREEKNIKPRKKSYATPKLTLYGNVEVITQGLGCPGSLDATFPVGTAYDAVECS